MSMRMDGSLPVEPVRDGTGNAVEVPLPEDVTAPRSARASVRDTLTRWQLTALLDSVLLAVSELVTNAVRHGRPPARLTLTRRDEHVVVDVRDSSPATPPLHGAVAVDGAESGRGLAIVSALADDVEVEQIPDDGKVVHARFNTDRAI